MNTTREIMEYDVVIVGAGPAGLSAAIRVQQLSQQHQKPLKICVLEKGSQIGAHILSGAVIEPRALNELIPDWRQTASTLLTPVTHDQFWYLSAKRRWILPTPAIMRNHGNYIVSLGALCRWLADYAQQLGVEIYTGFAASELLYEQQRVIGVATGDVGINKAGEPTTRYQRGMALHAKHLLLAEGCRGSLSEQVMTRFQLRSPTQTQTYGIGIKELWEIPREQHRPGYVLHTVGWPLTHATYGGSFLYHLGTNRVAVGLVIGLDYQNPYLNPFLEFQRFKTHPAIRPLLTGGKRIAYGARALNEGGYQAIPQLSFPGGMLIGDSAGFLNVAKIKGTHTAIKSAMIAAEICFAELTQQAHSTFNTCIEQSWIGSELYRVRNIRPAFRWGLRRGLAYAAIDQYLLRGHAPWTFTHHADHQQLKPAQQCSPIDYPPPDSQISFDLLSSVYLSNTHHEENQPCHLKLKDPNISITLNLAQYAAPEQRYCPAGVYEIISTANHPALQINAANCIHCKTCDIKDPSQNILWQPPEGGGGPHYEEM